MSIKSTIIVLCLFATSSLTSWLRAQQTWNLETCISHAITHNISIKRQRLQAEYNNNQKKQSNFDLYLPSLTGSGEYNYGFGRPINVSTSTISEVDIQNFTLGTNLGGTLFQGFTRINNKEAETYNALAANEDVKKIENNISLAITTYFLQVLFNTELLQIAKEQLLVTEQQVNRTLKLVEAGSLAHGNYLEIKAQLAKELLNVAQMENELDMSILNLAQLLDIEDPQGFNIVIPNLPEITISNSENPQTIFFQSQSIMPEIKSAEYKLKSSEYQEKAISGYRLPTLRAYANYDIRASKIEGDKTFDLMQQLKDKKTTNVGLSLSIPIFNKFSNLTKIKNAKIAVLDAQYQLQSSKQTLRKEIQQAYLDAQAALKKYQASQSAVTSYEESFMYTEKKFNLGLVTSVDYNLSKNDLTKSKSELLQAKYEYILRTKVLDFYKGIPISLQ